VERSKEKVDAMILELQGDFSRGKKGGNLTQMKGGNQRKPEEGSQTEAVQGREVAVSKEVARRMK